ncbi:MAG: tRNA pseudouridine(38-40) synthase TruA [Micrococcaceae bacterium]
MRVKIILAYDGAWFQGWGIQPDAPTIQGVLEQTLQTITGRLIRTTVAGRTDTGVHAQGQVVHCDMSEAEWYTFVSDYQDSSEAFIRRVNGLLQLITMQVTGTKLAKGAIQIKSVEPVAESFDARFSALWRRYSYTIEDKTTGWNPLNRHCVLHYRGQLDENAMNVASQLLLGEHNFIAFCKPRQGATTIRTLQEMYWKRHDGLLTVHLKADAFCHHMVRSLVGATLMVGSGEREPKWLYERLQLQQRNAEANIAPGHALVLEEIGYPEEKEWAMRADLTRAKRNFSQ